MSPEPIDHDSQGVDPRPRTASPRRADFWRRFVDAAVSLQCKATGLVVTLNLAVVAIVAGYLLRSSEQYARNQYDTQMVQMTAMLAKAAAGPIASGDVSTLERLAGEAADGSPLLYVIFSDLQGRQLAVAEHSNVHILQQLSGEASQRAPVPGRPVFRSGTKSIPVFVDISYPITTHGVRDPGAPRSAAPPTRLLGYVRTGMADNGWHRAMSSRMDMLVGVGILAAVAAIPLGFLLVRRIVSPLDGLAGVMRRFSEGQLDVRSPVARRDEIGRLAMSFNRMADMHQQTHNRIVRLNAELEKRVTQRTQQLRELASREPLTGLYNRRYFNEMLEHRYSEAVRYQSDLSCIMIDLDGFKAVNDAFGHHTGDETLVLTATTITSQLRSADVAARFGGDEFIVLLPQTDADRAYVLAERIAEQFQRRLHDRFAQVHVTISMGIASLASPDIKEAESLIRAADRALYAAKAAGKNHIIIDSAASRSATI